MPYKTSRVCRNRLCNGITTDSSGFCPKCKPKYQWQKKSDYKRIGGRKLQQIRAKFLRDNPLCVECLKQGIYKAAEIRDHIKPLAEGGLDTTDNTQALCVECHNKKTQAEAKRGQGASHSSRL